MSRYVEILATNRPFPFNTDESSRIMFSLNITAVAAAPVAQWEEEIAKVLVDAALSTGIIHPSTNPTGDFYVGPTATFPTGDGPYISMRDTGGLPPQETQNGDKYERLSAQLVVRALDYEAARTLALSIWNELDGQRDVTVTA